MKKEKSNKMGNLNSKRVYHPIIKSQKQAIVNLGSGEIAEYKNRFFKE